MGIFLHFYSTRLPQYFIFIDAVVETVMGFVSLKLDSNLQYTSNDPYNLTAWLVWGIGFELFTCIMIWRHFQTSKWIHLKLSLRSVNAEMAYESIPPIKESNEFVEESSSLSKEIRTNFLRVVDARFTIAALGVLITSLFLSTCIAQYNGVIL